MRIKVVLEDAGARKNGAKVRTTWKYSPTHPRGKLQSKHLWVGKSCWGKNIELELVVKGWAHKKTPFVSFPNRLLENAKVKSAFIYALSSQHNEAKWNTNGIAKGTSVKLAYPMKNKMPLVHHAIKQWGYDYTIKDGKGLNERTQGQSMLKPMSKLMQTGWE